MKNKKFYKKKSKVDKNLLFPSKPCHDAFLKHSKLSVFLFLKKFFHLFFKKIQDFVMIYGILLMYKKKGGLILKKVTF